MVKKFSKPFVTFGAIFLMLWDVSLFFVQGQLSFEQLFSTVFTNFVPVKFLLGITMLLYINEHNNLKLWASITEVVSSVMAAIRIFALILQIVLIAKGMGETGTAEYFEIAYFTGGILLLFATTFFMEFLKGRKFKKTVLVFSLSAVILFLAYHVADFVFAVEAFKLSGLSGVGEFIANCFTGEFIMSVLGIIAYLAVFTIPTGVFEKAEKN